MPRISLVTLALIGAMAAGPAAAAPQFAGTNDAAGTGGDHTVDCSDYANRYMPFCESINNQALSKPAPTITGVRTNSLLCPSDELVPAGTDRHGNRLYRCAVSSPAARANSRAMSFFPGN